MIHIGLRGPVAYALAVATPDDDGTLSANIILTTTSTHYTIISA